MNDDRKCAVLVAGAGPTGLMLALWLARLGVHVRIVDRAEGPGTTSRALVVHARSLEFYQQLGLSEEAIAGGRKFAGVRLWTHGKCRGHVALGEMGEGLSPFPYLLILPQDEQERLLAAALRRCGVEVERRTELVGFEDREATIAVRLRGPGGGEELCTCSYLAGCDGAHSTVRDALGVRFAGAAYDHLFYVADVQAGGPALGNGLSLALDAGDFLAIFPLPGDGTARLIGTIRDDATDERGDALRWEDVSPTIFERLPLDVGSVNWFSTYRVHHRVASRFRRGHAFLLGDAAHIHSPVGGQGMNTGLGDAVNLAWKLAMVLDSRADDRLLESYEPERIAFARRLVATTDRAFSLVTRNGPFARVVREDIVPRVVPPLLQIDAVRRYAFRTLSQIMVEYEASSLSAGHIGDVHGGDRLPWTGSNFAPLTAIAWQAHVYGDVPTPFAKACADLGLPLHAFPGNAAAGMPEGAACLVRPDGYIALADATADAGRLLHYFHVRGLRPS